MDEKLKYFLVIGMLSTGTLNTLLNKYQDLECVAYSPDKTCSHTFEQPLLQTLNMFVGEIMCLFLFLVQGVWERRRRGVAYQAIPSQGGEEEEALLAADGDGNGDGDGEENNGNNSSISSEHQVQGESKPLLAGWLQVLFLLPTLCDLTATTLMNVGLLYVSASIYQMLRGSVVLFTGCFSTLFLGIKHPKYRWVALFVVFLGVAIVGTSSLFKPSAPKEKEGQPSNPWIGIAMIILAQCFTATQFVVEEKIMHLYRVPAVKAVGLEGLFGLVLTVGAVPILHYTVGVSRPLGPGNPFDMFESFRELLIPNIFYAAIGICFSISLFNWCGLAVTQSISATSRSTIDTCRTLFIWVFSLAFGWETFSFLQVIGFLVLIYGTFLFNDVVPPPYFLVDEREIQLVEDVLIAPAGAAVSTTSSARSPGTDS